MTRLEYRNVAYQFFGGSVKFGVLLLMMLLVFGNGDASGCMSQ